MLFLFITLIKDMEIDYALRNLLFFFVPEINFISVCR